MLPALPRYGRSSLLFFEDFSPWLCASSLSEGKKLKAVGWLELGKPYARRERELPETCFVQLLSLLERPWEPLHYMGSHECEFCWGEPRVEGYVEGYIERYKLKVHFGANNLYLPAEGCVYVAPSMIAHYVDAHSYEPPAAFWEAVMKCPEMCSEAYMQALIANGPSTEGWVRAVQAGG